MRYRASVEIDYALGEALAGDAHHALTAAVKQAFAETAGITATNLAVISRRTPTLTVEATLADRNLTNPLDALVCLVTALDKALLRTGLLEEFDMARERLAVGPA